MRLQTPCLRTLHVIADLPHFGCIHAVVCQCTLFEQFLTMLSVRQIIDDLMQTGLHVRLITIPDRLDEKISEALLAEKLAENIEDASAEGLPLQLDFFEETLVHITFARLVRQQVPEMTHFGLADPVNAAEALFEAVRVPRQVIVDHQVCTL